MTFDEEIKHAVGAHGVWKIRLTKAIETRTCEIDTATARSDNNCDFGRWLHGLARDQKCDVHCEQVMKLHADFHEAAGDVLALALAGNQQGARDAMAPTAPFGKASLELTLAMQRWLAALPKAA